MPLTINIGATCFTFANVSGYRVAAAYEPAAGLQSNVSVQVLSVEDAAPGQVAPLCSVAAAAAPNPELSQFLGKRITSVQITQPGDKRTYRFRDFELRSAETVAYRFPLDGQARERHAALLTFIGTFPHGGSRNAGGEELMELTFADTGTVPSGQVGTTALAAGAGALQVKAVTEAHLWKDGTVAAGALAGTQTGILQFETGRDGHQPWISTLLDQHRARGLSAQLSMNGRAFPSQRAAVPIPPAAVPQQPPEPVRLSPQSVSHLLAEEVQGWLRAFLPAPPPLRIKEMCDSNFSAWLAPGLAALDRGWKVERSGAISWDAWERVAIRFKAGLGPSDVLFG